jgi:hypothetical protein
MIEIIVLIFLTRGIGSIVMEKGYNPTPFKTLTIILWFLVEVLAILIALPTAKSNAAAYFWGFIGAGIGAAIIFLIVLSLPEKDAFIYKVNGEKLTVHKQAHESSDILLELEIGTECVLYLRSTFERFYKVKLSDGQSGYILKTALNPKSK